MIGPGRRFSSVALLLFFASLFAAASVDAQQKNSWDGAIDALAAKIAADAGPRALVHLSVKNLSSLDAVRVADFTAALEAQLRQRGVRVEKSGAAIHGIRILEIPDQ